MEKPWQKREISLIVLLILCGAADVNSSLPVDIAIEEKGESAFLVIYTPEILRKP